MECRRSVLLNLNRSNPDVCSRRDLNPGRCRERAVSLATRLRELCLDVDFNF